MLPILRGRLWSICYDFSSPEGVKTVADPYGSLRQPYIDWLQGQIGKSGPTYGGEITAPITSQETDSLGKVNDFANSDITQNKTYKSANDFTNSFLNDNFDPSTSPYYQAIKATANTNLQDTNNQIASDAAGGGRYWTGARLKQQGRASTAVNENLNTTLAQLQQQNTQQKLGLIPQALTMANTEQQQPLQQAAAEQTFGALPRNLQQNTDNALLNQFYQSQYQYPLNIAQIIAGVQQPPVYQQNPNSWTQNATQAYMKLLGQGVQAAGTAAAGGA